MAFRGQRFVVDLDDDVLNIDNQPPEDFSPSPLGLIREIRERSPSTAVPPAPKPPSGSTGFPQHRRRTTQSSFKQRRANKEQDQPESSAPKTSPPTIGDEKKSIDEENRRQLASMSDAQIKEEREELMSSMGSSLLERFLRRARIDDELSEERTPPLKSESSPSQETASKPKKSVSFDVEETPPLTKETTTTTTTTTTTIPAAPVSSSIINHEDLPPAQIPDDLHPAFQFPGQEAFHFPTPPRQNTMPNLDPSSPSFLSDLQTHYFPEISHDPSALSWLQTPSSDPEDPDSTSAYHPASSAVAVHPAALRFSLIGTIISPATSLSLPTTLGLHHHGKDPHAAGYTIPELAILSRSSFPAQRCIAWQVIGRILFRLGKGQFGERGSPLVEGLWFVVENEGVVAGMLVEADRAGSGSSRRADTTNPPAKESDSGAKGSNGVGRHASASAWAVEGVWLWQMGGAGDRGILKENTIRSQ